MTVILKSSLVSLLICFFFCLKISRGYKFYGENSTFNESIRALVTFICLTFFFCFWWRAQSYKTKNIFKHNCLLLATALCFFLLSLFTSKAFFSYKEAFIIGTFPFYICSIILIILSATQFVLYRSPNEENNGQLSCNDKAKRFF